jgi:hypothetical protein
MIMKLSESELQYLIGLVSCSQLVQLRSSRPQIRSRTQKLCFTNICTHVNTPTHILRIITVCLPQIWHP